MANETSDIGLTQNRFILIHVINNGTRHIECKRQNRFKTQDCRIIGVESNAQGGGGGKLLPIHSLK